MFMIYSTNGLISRDFQKWEIVSWNETGKKQWRLKFIKHDFFMFYSLDESLWVYINHFLMIMSFIIYGLLMLMIVFILSYMFDLFYIYFIFIKIKNI